MLFTPSKICKKITTKAAHAIRCEGLFAAPPTKRASATRALDESQKVAEELMLFATGRLEEKETHKIVGGRITTNAIATRRSHIHAQCFFNVLVFIIIVRCHRRRGAMIHIDERRNRFQPLVPQRLPCYDLIPVTNIIFTRVPLIALVVCINKTQASYKSPLLLIIPIPGT